MYNLEKINRMIDDINRFFSQLDEIKDISDNVKMHASSMLILGIMNRAVDTAQEIAVVKDIPMPSSYKEVFPLLASKGIINKDIGEKMEILTSERGLFAHHYYEADKKKLIKLKKDVYIVKNFMENIKKFIRKDAGGKNESN